MYSRPLPRKDNLKGLAIVARPYPKTAARVLRAARNWHFSRSVIDFLKLFPENEEFESTDDFLMRCEEVENMIRDKRL